MNPVGLWPPKLDMVLYDRNRFCRIHHAQQLQQWCFYPTSALCSTVTFILDRDRNMSVTSTAA